VRPIPRGDEVAGGRGDDAALPHDRFEEHGRGRIVDGRGERLGVAVRDVNHVAGQWGERFLLRRLPRQCE
jgi:hypothetical protein